MSEDGPGGAPPGEEGVSREAEILAARRASLERLREMGVAPFALDFEVDAHAADLRSEFPDGTLAPGQESDRRAAVAGRVVLARRHGKITFLVIRDRTGDLQLLCERTTMGEGGNRPCSDSFCNLKCVSRAAISLPVR